MGRRKVKLAFIVNDTQRKVTFKKRRKGLMKKVNELSTLCGVDVGAIIYSPFEDEADVWPSHSGVHSVIEKFKRMPVMEQNKKMMDNEGFTRQRAVKVNEKLKKQVLDNREKDVAALMYQCLGGRGLQNLRMEDLNDLDWLIDQNLDDIKNRIATLKIKHMQEGESRRTIVGNVGLQKVKQVVDLAADESIKMPEWVNERMNALNEQIGFCHGDEVIMQFNEASNNGTVMTFNDADNKCNMMSFNDAYNNGSMMPFNDADDSGSMMPFIDANNNGNIMRFDDANNNGNMRPFHDVNNNGNIWPDKFRP